MKNWLVALALVVSALALSADVVDPAPARSHTVIRTVSWVIPVAVIFLVIAIASRKKRNRT